MYTAHLIVYTGAGWQEGVYIRTTLKKWLILEVKYR